jgi:glyoxylase-like metal-dependent hydrolase (beta-lactamase superfamily II)
VNPLKGNVYWTQGGTGGNNCNTGFVVGDRGVIVIDAKLNAESARLMLDAIRTITAKPVTHVILTHSDGDHVNGLAAFPAGITVIAHEGAESELERAFAAGGRGAPPVSAAPTEVVRGSGESLTIDGVKLRLVHVAPAHTSGDLAVFFHDQRILFTGDLMATTRPEPLVHTEKGGTSDGFVQSYRAMIALGAETIVTGHGVLVTNVDLQKRMMGTEARRDRVRALVAQGKSLEEVRQELGDPVTVAGPGGRGAVASLTEIIYHELK